MNNTDSESEISFSCRDEVMEWLDRRAQEEMVSVSSLVEQIVVEKYHEESGSAVSGGVDAGKSTKTGSVDKEKVAMSLEDAKDGIGGGISGSDQTSTESEATSPNSQESDGAEEESTSEDEESDDGEGDDEIQEAEKNVPEAETVTASGEGNGNPEDKLKKVLGGTNLLKEHDDKWDELGSNADGSYEVELPDGDTEKVRTKDDVRALLMKNYD